MVLYSSCFKTRIRGPEEILKMFREMEHLDLLPFLEINFRKALSVDWL